MIKDDSLEEGPYRFYIKREKRRIYDMQWAERRSLPWVQHSLEFGKVCEDVEGFSLGQHLGLISNAVCPVQPMGSWPRPCSRLTCPPWTTTPAPGPPTGAPLWRTPWCALEEMEFALDARWTLVGSVRSPTPGPSPLCLLSPPFPHPPVPPLLTPHMQTQLSALVSEWEWFCASDSMLTGSQSWKEL